MLSAEGGQKAPAASRARKKKAGGARAKILKGEKQVGTPGAEITARCLWLREANLCVV